MRREKAMQLLESEHDEIVAGPSDRNFGLTMAAVLTLIGGFGLYKGSSHAPLWLCVAAVFCRADALAAAVAESSRNDQPELWSKFLQGIHTPERSSMDVGACRGSLCSIVLRSKQKF